MTVTVHTAMLCKQPANGLLCKQTIFATLLQMQFGDFTRMGIKMVSNDMKRCALLKTLTDDKVSFNLIILVIHLNQVVFET